MIAPAFKIKRETAKGKISISLVDEVDCQKISQIVQFISNLLDRDDGKVVFDGIIKGEKFIKEDIITRKLRQMSDRFYKDVEPKHISNRNLDRITIGIYKEPTVGVRILFLDCDMGDRIQAIKKFHELTDISLKGSKEIISGECLCPKLSVELANKVMNAMKAFDIYAKVVSDEDAGSKAYQMALTDAQG